MKSILLEGAKFPLEELSMEDRASDLQEALEFGITKELQSNQNC